MAVDFAGFREVVAAIGGVEVYFPRPARDAGSGLIIEEAGCQVLDAEMALAYARSRHYQTFTDGRWVRDNLDDWGRMQRQQEFLRLAMSRAIDRGARNPATLNAIVNGVLGDQAVILDDQLTTGMILEIAMAFRLFNPGSLGGYGLRDYVDDEWKGNLAVLVLRENEAEPLLDLFRGTQGLDPTPETVRVRVLNGSGEPNQASEVAADLRLADFVVRSTDNARVDLDRTEVRYAPGQLASAELLARYLAVAPILIEDRELTQVPVVLATGADYTGLLAEPRDPRSPSRPSPTTTDPAPTTTAEVIDPDQPDHPGDAPPAPAC